MLKAARTLLSCAVLLIVCAAGTQAQTITEGFESGTKTSYAAANVSLGSGVWNMNDALIGTLSTDRRTGAASARLRNTGTVRMLFDKGGAGTVTIQHAVFGSDGPSSWELWYSTNGGTSYSKIGPTINTTSTTLQTATFTLNVTSQVRLEVRKVTGSANRLNIDNITITDAGPAAPPVSVHLTLGNPSGATTSTSNPTNYLMLKPQFALSYHRDRGEPNWVSWHLSSDWLGSTPRQDNFRADTTLPSGWYRVQGTDYSGSGYDRGHMCPSADRTLTIADNSATFLMTNMIPQAPDNNQGPWANLESYCRSLVNAGNELYIISGGDGSLGTIVNGRVTIPAFTWKIIVVLPEGENDLARITTSTRVIVVDMPNSQGLRNHDWRQYRTSVNAVEGFTGYDFLSNVSITIQSVIETRVDNQ
jgi:endonuclease G